MTGNYEISHDKIRLNSLFKTFFRCISFHLKAEIHRFIVAGLAWKTLYFSSQVTDNVCVFLQLLDISLTLSQLRNLEYCETEIKNWPEKQHSFKFSKKKVFKDFFFDYTCKVITQSCNERSCNERSWKSCLKWTKCIRDFLSMTHYLKKSKIPVNHLHNL